MKPWRVQSGNLDKVVDAQSCEEACWLAFHDIAIGTKLGELIRIKESGKKDYWFSVTQRYIDIEGKKRKKGRPEIPKAKKALIVTLLAEKKYSCREIAEKAGVNRNTVDKIKQWLKRLETK